MNDPIVQQRFDALEGLFMQQYRDLSGRLRRMEEGAGEPTTQASLSGNSLQELDQFFLKQRDALGKTLHAALPTPNRANPRRITIPLIVLNLLSLAGHAALALWRCL